jgi:pectin methylesterase-like acyl-CoA thioesterase
MAAVFLLLAGGANALANTVWCVPKASLNPACTALTTKLHIQDAVSAAASQDVIVVGPGKYNESVSITTANLSLLGAQAGNDARDDRHYSSRESIVDASGTPYGSGGGAVFYVDAKNVVIDGFTIQGGHRRS